MKRILFLTVSITVFLFISRSVKSQNNFQKGYIVSNNNDTIEGYIDFQQWEKNPKQVGFKTDLKSETKTYSPIEINSFFVKNELYLGAIVDVDRSPFKTENLTFENIPLIEKDTVFLSVYAKGEISLFYLKDENLKDHFFINKPNEDIVELVYRRCLKKIDENTTVVIKYEYYKGLLKVYMGDYKGIDKKIDKLRYSAKPLVELINEYNESKGKLREVYYNSSARNFKVTPQLLLGAYYTSYHIHSSSFENKGDFSTTYSMNQSNTNATFGIGFSLMSPRKLQRLSLYQELLFYSEDVYFEYTTTERPTLYYDNLIDFNVKYAKFSLLGRYQLKFNSFKPYLNLGFSMGLPIIKEGIRTSTKHFVDQVDVTEINQSFLTVGLNAGIGAFYKRFNMELRYESGGTSALPSSSYNLYLLLGYNLTSSK